MASIPAVDLPVNITINRIEVNGPDPDLIVLGLADEFSRQTKASELHAQFVTASKALAATRRLEQAAADRMQVARSEHQAAMLATHDAERARESIIEEMRRLQDGASE